MHVHVHAQASGFIFSLLLAVLSTVFISLFSILTAFYVTILLARMSLCLFIRFDVCTSIIPLILSCFLSY